MSIKTEKFTNLGSTNTTTSQYKSDYKSASILPYRYHEGEYYYLICMEKKGEWCSSFGGHMESIDKNNYWNTACRELAEELYGLKPDPEMSLKYQKLIRKNGLTRRYVIPYPKNRHCDYMCHWKHILLSKTTPTELVKNFQPNDEIKSIHWIKATDLWSIIEEIAKNNSKFRGPNAEEFWIATNTSIPGELDKVRLRPCFINSSLNFYRLGKHKIHVKPKPI
jgi:hypothetical protein